MTIETVFKGLNTAEKVARALYGLIKSSKGSRRTVLLELKENINLILLYTNDGAPIDRVIKKLATKQYRAALASGFNFNSLKRSMITASTIDGVDWYRPYIGWTTEQLFEQITLKISELQNIVDIDTDNRKLRKGVRLKNILKLMLLLLRHIRG